MLENKDYPPYGYRLMKPGETIKEGDIVFWPNSWTPVSEHWYKCKTDEGDCKMYLGNSACAFFYRTNTWRGRNKSFA